MPILSLMIRGGIRLIYVKPDRLIFMRTQSTRQLNDHKTRFLLLFITIYNDPIRTCSGKGIQNGKLLAPQQTERQQSCFLLFDLLARKLASKFDNCLSLISTWLALRNIKLTSFKRTGQEKGEGSRLGQANSARKCMRTRLSCLCNLFDSLSWSDSKTKLTSTGSAIERKWPGHCRKYIYIGCRWPRICDCGYT